MKVKIKMNVQNYFNVCSASRFLLTYGYLAFVYCFYFCLFDFSILHEVSPQKIINLSLSLAEDSPDFVVICCSIFSCYNEEGSK